MKKFKIIFFIGVLSVFLIGLAQPWYKLTVPHRPKISDCNHESIPRAAYTVALYILQTGQAPPSYRQLSTFYITKKQSEFPLSDQNGNKIHYTESDIYPSIPGVNRGPERLVISSNGDVYYTYDHYQHYIKITSICINRFKRAARDTR